MHASLSLPAVEQYLQHPGADDRQSTMAAASVPAIKIEEHVAPSTITPDLLSLATPESSPCSSKQPKKRKSWGQVLPEPTTALPPRKRAKTADEKEQRRIERVKRNRLAAHNSRERKREEMEQLQVVNDGLVAQMDAMREQMKAMAAEINALRGASSSTSVPPSIPPFDFTTLTKHETLNQAPPSVSSPPMTVATSALQTPDLGNLDSPDMDLLDEFPATPMEDRFVSFTEVSLMPQLFRPANTAANPNHQRPSTVVADGPPHIPAQPSSLPLECVDTFLNFDSHETGPKPAPSSSSYADFVDITTPVSSFDDLLDDGASASSDFLDFIAADQGAPAKGSDGSGCQVEDGAYAQFLAETIVLS